jgi:hypothetical protein
MGWAIWEEKPSPSPKLFTRIGTQIYKMSYHQKIFNFLLEKNPSAAHTALEATLYLKILSIQKEKIEALIQLKKVYLKSTPSNTLLTNKLAEYYSRTVGITFAPNGQILSFAFPGLAENYVGYKQMFQQMEILFLPEYKEKQIQTDTLGTYEADYHYTANRVIRHKRRYTSSSQNNRILLYASEANTTTLGKWYTDFTMHENLRILHKKEKLAEIHTQIKLIPYTPTEISQEPIVLLTEEKRLARIKYDKNIFKSIEEIQLKQAFQKKRTTLKHLLATIIQAPNNLSYWNDLELFLRLYPNKINDLLPYLNQDNTPIARDIIAILEHLGLAQSQDLLATVSTDSDSDPMNRIRSIIALSSQKQPTDSVLLALEELIDSRDDDNQKDRADTALLALGSLCKNPTVATEYSEYIQNALENASNYSTSKIAILSAKNGGTLPWIEGLIPYLHASDSRLRSLSLTALSIHIEDARVRNALEAQLHREQNPKIKERIKNILYQIKIQ